MFYIKKKSRFFYSSEFDEGVSGRYLALAMHKVT